MLGPVDKIPWSTISIDRRSCGGAKVEDKTRMRALIDLLDEGIDIGPAVMDHWALLHLPWEDMRLRDSEVKLLLDLWIESWLENLRRREEER
jgi:hypothetical protein